MYLNLLKCRALGLFSISLFIGLMLNSCQPKVATFTLPEATQIDAYRSVYSNELRPLKREWKELYAYLKAGHLLVKVDGAEGSPIYSHEFYRFIQKHLLKIYETPYLQSYDQFIKAFGSPDNYFERQDRIQIGYNPSVLDDPCHTCEHYGFPFLFDKATKKLVKK